MYTSDQDRRHTLSTSLEPASNETQILSPRLIVSSEAGLDSLSPSISPLSSSTSPLSFSASSEPKRTSASAPTSPTYLNKADTLTRSGTPLCQNSLDGGSRFHSLSVNDFPSLSHGVTNIYIFNTGPYSWNEPDEQGIVRLKGGWIADTTKAGDPETAFVCFGGVTEREKPSDDHSPKIPRIKNRYNNLKRERVHVIRTNDKKQYDMFYLNFCNEVLWPHFHRVLKNNEVIDIYEPANDKDDVNWKAYVELNKVYADKICRLIKKNGLDLNKVRFLVQDYQLMLVPALIKQQYPNAKVGFFFHVPVPDPALCAKIPHMEELTKGILAADSVGFQTPGYAENFEKYVAAYLKDSVTTIPAQKDSQECDHTIFQIKGCNHKAVLGAYPIGINTKLYSSVKANNGSLAVKAATDFIGAWDLECTTKFPFDNEEIKERTYYLVVPEDLDEERVIVYQDPKTKKPKNIKISEVPGLKELLEPYTFPIATVTAISNDDIFNDKILTHIENYIRPSRTKLLLSIGRSDPSKNLLRKMEAIELLLDRMQSGKSKLSPKQFAMAFQILPGSRDHIPAYAKLKEDLVAKAAKINNHPFVKAYNAAHPDDSWEVVHTFTKNLASTAELAAVYRKCDGLIEVAAPDGMNLVIEEYVVSNKNLNKGRAVLSNRTGAATQLIGATLVDPYSVEAIANSIEEVLLMPESECQRRMQAMNLAIEDGAARWRKDQKADLEAAYAANQAAMQKPKPSAMQKPKPFETSITSTSTSPLSTGLSLSTATTSVDQSALQTFSFLACRHQTQAEKFAAKIRDAINSKKQLVIFSDYDGTIAPFVIDATKALPAENTIRELTKFAQFITMLRPTFITGRAIPSLQRVLGDYYKPFDIVGDHGLSSFIDGNSEMTQLPSSTANALETLKQDANILIAQLKKNYGIEDKNFKVEVKIQSFAFHWRAIKDPDHPQTNHPNADEIITKIEKFFTTERLVLMKECGLKKVPGSCVCEVMRSDVSKGDALRAMLNKLGDSVIPVFFGDEFVKQNGEEGTDFSAAKAVRGAGGIVIQVLQDGNKLRNPLATYTVESPAALGDFLERVNELVHERKAINDKPNCQKVSSDKIMYNAK